MHIQFVFVHRCSSYVSTHWNINTRLCIYTQVRIHVHVYAYTYVNMYIYICMCLPSLVLHAISSDQCQKRRVTRAGHAANCKLSTSPQLSSKVTRILAPSSDIDNLKRKAPIVVCTLPAVMYACIACCCCCIMDITCAQMPFCQV